MSFISSLLIFVSILLVSVILHECGHFLACRLTGVRVNQFMVGMGPGPVLYKGKKTSIKLGLFPIGGACVINDDDFRDASGKKKMIILAAGVTVNLILAYISMMVCDFCMDGTVNPISALQLMGETAVGYITTLGSSFMISLNPTISGVGMSSEYIGSVMSTATTPTMHVAIIANFMFLINLILAVANLLPIPGLDGGQMLLYFPQVFNKQIDQRKVNWLNFVCGTSLTIISCYIILKDTVVILLK